MAVNNQSLQEYISSFPAELRVLLENVRETILKAAPGAQEAMSYGIPTFKLHGKNLVHFAGYKNHIGFYPTPSAIKAFAKELSAWESAKGSVKFPIKDPLPYQLIHRMVQFRVNEMKDS